MESQIIFTLIYGAVCFIAGLWIGHVGPSGVIADIEQLKADVITLKTTTVKKATPVVAAS